MVRDFNMPLNTLKEEEITISPKIGKGRVGLSLTRCSGAITAPG
jgi:hypothetical protein